MKMNKIDYIFTDVVQSFDRSILWFDTGVHTDYKQIAAWQYSQGEDLGF